MATPTTNGLSVTGFDRADTDVPWLVYDHKWGGALGTGITMTWSYSVSGAAFKSNYGEFGEPLAIVQLTSAERAAIQSAFDTWGRFANVTFDLVAESTTNVGDIRIGKSDNNPGRTGHAYLPEDIPESGDIWFNPDNWNDDGGSVPLGSFDFYVILHEIGHALGLEHPFDDPPTAPEVYNNHFYTVMAYKASPGSNVAGGFGDYYPTTPMFYDILAIQEMYGKKLVSNDTDTDYVFTQGVKYFRTIFDTGGDDTITYNGSDSSRISLVIGSFSKVSSVIRFDVGSSRETVAIGPDTIIENAVGGTGSDELIGNSSNNRLTGNAGSDTLNGGGGADTMDGGTGADIYYVNHDGDVVIESTTNDGTDTVNSSVTFTLSANVENLVITGSAARFGAGNALNNVMTGNGAANKLRGYDGNDTLNGGAGNDTLEGGAGADSMSGSSGNDSYSVDHADDRVREVSANHGVDTVRTSVTFTLGTYVEHLTMAGAASRNANGNALNNSLTGNDGDNSLSGRAGADTLNGGEGNDRLTGGDGLDRLTGGFGADVFVFDAARSSANSDTITDFNVANDTFHIENAIFTQLGAAGALDAGALRIGSSAQDANDFLIYNPNTGALYFDSNGDAAGGAVRIATLSSGLALTSADFLVI